MQKMLIDEVNPGDVIAKDIYNNEGVMLISKGTVFREDFVDRLQDTEVREIFIEEYEQENAKIIENFQKSFHLDDVIYEKTREQVQKHMKKMIAKFSAMGRINIHKLYIVIEQIMGQLLSKKDIVLTLSRLRSVDEYTYEHLVNVCVLSLIVGIDLNLNKDALKNLGTGAILHDIGKVGISEKILKKPSRLTNEEYEEIKKHTVYGYEILSHADVSEEAAMIALYHHEKFDGTGYKKRLIGKNIPLFSRIVAVADVYDAMSNDRVYKKKLPPDKVYRDIIRLGDKHFDAEILELFVRHLSLYPIGTGVVLNTNHKGIVIGQNKLLPESPVVRLFKKDNKDLKLLPVDIDLSSTKYIYIKDTF